jgi:la-related protein 1
MDDMDIQQIIIVMQTPPAVFRKHPGGDRTGQSYNRSKLTVDIAQAINDGLYFYEQVSWMGWDDGSRWCSFCCDELTYWSVFLSIFSDDPTWCPV